MWSRRASPAGRTISAKPSAWTNLSIAFNTWARRSCSKSRTTLPVGVSIRQRRADGAKSPIVRRPATCPICVSAETATAARILSRVDVARTRVAIPGPRISIASTPAPRLRVMSKRPWTTPRSYPRGRLPSGFDSTDPLRQGPEALRQGVVRNQRELGVVGLELQRGGTLMDGDQVKTYGIDHVLGATTARRGPIAREHQRDTLQLALKLTQDANELGHKDATVLRERSANGQCEALLPDPAPPRLCRQSTIPLRHRVRRAPPLPSNLSTAHTPMGRARTVTRAAIPSNVTPPPRSTDPTFQAGGGPQDVARNTRHRGQPTSRSNRRSSAHTLAGSPYGEPAGPPVLGFPVKFTVTPRGGGRADTDKVVDSIVQYLQPHPNTPPEQSHVPPGGGGSGAVLRRSG